MPMQNNTDRKPKIQIIKRIKTVDEINVEYGTFYPRSGQTGQSENGDKGKAKFNWELDWINQENLLIH